MREKRLEGRVALVSGGSTGIGAAIVRRLAAEGAHVGLGDINTGDGEQVVQAVTASGGSACFMPLDVTDASHWQEAVQKLVTEHGRLDILVNNAGIYARTPIDKIDEQEWQRVIDVNVKGVFLGAQAAIPEMRKTGQGSIINISSTAGLRGSIATHYGASKGAVRLMSKSIAVQCAKDGIRCNSVHPGPVDTTMGHAAVPEDIREERFGRIPLGRFGSPEEIAGAVYFLASDDSTFMTGSELIVDGGSTAA
ncbi:MAG: SDR family NAD(P)-dependent oxidoreductase [Pseudomonadota bacterium]